MSHKKINGLALRQQSQALTPETERSVKEATPIVDDALRAIRSQLAADDAFKVIVGDTQASDFLADAMVASDNPRVFLAQIQKHIARAFSAKGTAQSVPSAGVVFVDKPEGIGHD